MNDYDDKVGSSQPAEEDMRAKYPGDCGTPNPANLTNTTQRAASSPSASLGSAGVIGSAGMGVQQDRRSAETTYGDIGWAVRQMQRGHRVTRRGWNGKNMWLRIKQNSVGVSDDGFYRVPYVEMKTATNVLIPGLCSQTDLLAQDWTVV